MAPLSFSVLFLPVFASQVLASCAHGTHILPRAEGAIKVNTFGYTGNIVSHLSILFRSGTKSH